MRGRLVRAARLVYEYGRVKTARLALDVGLSYKHFRYYVVPELTALVKCIRYERDTDELVWCCCSDEESKTILTWIEYAKTPVPL